MTQCNLSHLRYDCMILGTGLTEDDKATRQQSKQSAYGSDTVHFVVQTHRDLESPVIITVAPANSRLME